VAKAEAYLRAKFRLDPSNRLATVHERYRQTDRQTDRQDIQRSDSVGRTVLQTVAQKKSNEETRNKNPRCSEKNGPVMKSVESVLRSEESLWLERYVKEVGLEPGVKEGRNYGW